MVCCHQSAAKAWRSGNLVLLLLLHRLLCLLCTHHRLPSSSSRSSSNASSSPSTASAARSLATPGGMTLLPHESAAEAEVQLLAVVSTLTDVAARASTRLLHSLCTAGLLLPGEGREAPAAELPPVEEPAAYMPAEEAAASPSPPPLQPASAKDNSEKQEQQHNNQQQQRQQPQEHQGHQQPATQTQGRILLPAARHIHVPATGTNPVDQHHEPWRRAFHGRGRPCVRPRTVSTPRQL